MFGLIVALAAGASQAARPSSALTAEERAGPQPNLRSVESGDGIGVAAPRARAGDFSTSEPRDDAGPMTGADWHAAIPNP